MDSGQEGYTVYTNITVKCQSLYPCNVSSENYSLLGCDTVHLGRELPILVAAGTILKFDAADPLQIIALNSDLKSIHKAKLLYPLNKMPFCYNFVPL